MYFVDQNGNKIRRSNSSFSSLPHKQEQRRSAVENFGYAAASGNGNGKSNDSKCPVWVYWVLGGIGVVLLIVLILCFVYRKKESYGSSSSSPMGYGHERFGFRFY